jgi:anti-sigma B factor antagonist
LIADLAAVTFMDSTAIGALVQLHNAANEDGKRLVLVSVAPRVLRVLEITGLDTVFDIAAAP